MLPESECCLHLLPPPMSSYPGHLNSLHNLAETFLKLKLSPSLSPHPPPLVAISFFGLNKLAVGQLASTGMLLQALLPASPASPTSPLWAALLPTATLCLSLIPPMSLPAARAVCPCYFLILFLNYRLLAHRQLSLLLFSPSLDTQAAAFLSSSY